MQGPLVQGLRTWAQASRVAYERSAPVRTYRAVVAKVAGFFSAHTWARVILWCVRVAAGAVWAWPLSLPALAGFPAFD